MKRKSMTKLIDTKTAAETLGISANTLKKYRVVGGGPIFHKFGRSVRYDPMDLSDYMRLNRYDNTAQFKAASDGEANSDAPE